MAVGSIVTAFWGPNTVVAFRTIYVCVLLLVVGAIAVAAIQILKGAAVRPDSGYLVAFGLLALGVVLAGGNLAAGFVLVLAVPVACLLLVPHVSPISWVAGAIAALFKVVPVGMLEAANPTWWLSSPFHEGNQGVIGVPGPGTTLAGIGSTRLPLTFFGASVAGAACVCVVFLLFIDLPQLPRGARIVARLALMVFLALAMATLSRTPIAAVVIALCSVFMSGRTRGGLRWTTLVVGLLLLYAVSGPLLNGLVQDRSPLSDRVAIAGAALKAWEESPVRGIGFGELSKTYVGGYPVYHAHFWPVQYLVELGLAGGVGMVLLMWRLGRAAWTSGRSRAVFLGLLVIPALDVGVLLYGRSAVVFWLAVAAAARPRPGSERLSRVYESHLP